LPERSPDIEWQRDPLMPWHDILTDPTARRAVTEQRSA
jgi:hypothetical protein